MDAMKMEIAIEIKTKKGPVLSPSSLQFWNLSEKNHPKHLQDLVPNAPFKFYTDAILSLCYYKMGQYTKLPKAQWAFAEKAYKIYDPYTELFHKSNPRIRSLRTTDFKYKNICENFEKSVNDLWHPIFQSEQLNLADLEPLLEVISDFESQLQSPLIYNHQVQYSPSFTEKMICFYSLLFHLRSIIAIDHNAHAQDSSFESVLCDSISDYLSKSDYTINDALLYLSFKKLSLPFVGHKDKDVRLEKLFVEPMTHHFEQYSHNACHLVNNLPPSFLNSLNKTEVEEALHHVQMDWLLGSEAGLLFKVREELYAALYGYEKVFWSHCSTLKAKRASGLNLCFKVSEKDLHQSEAA